MNKKVYKKSHLISYFLVLSATLVLTIVSAYLRISEKRSILKNRAFMAKIDQITALTQTTAYQSILLLNSVERNQESQLMKNLIRDRTNLKNAFRNLTLHHPMKELFFQIFNQSELHWNLNKYIENLENWYSIDKSRRHRDHNLINSIIYLGTKNIPFISKKIEENLSQRIYSSSSLIDIYFWVLIATFLGFIILQIYFIVRPFSKSIDSIENEFLKERSLLTSIVENSFTGILVTNSAGDILLSNKKFWRILGKGAQLDKNLSTFYEIFDIYHEDRISKIPFKDLPVIQAAYGVRVSNKILYLKNSIDSTDAYIEISATPIKLIDGEIYGVAFFKDISKKYFYEIEKNKTKEQLKRTNKMKNDFISLIGHEFRTPLNAIIGYSELLIENCKDRNEMEEFSDCQTIWESGMYLKKLMDQILIFSETETAKYKVDYKPIDLETLLKKIVNDSKPNLADNKNEIEIILSSNMEIFISDKDILHSILDNVISNAIQFTKRGKIKIYVCKKELKNRCGVEIKISDNGDGIPREKIQYIFENFTQAHDTSIKPLSGIGMGLSISKKLCEIIGGSIKLDSEEKIGTTFYIWIPMGSNQPSRKIA